MNTHAQKQNNQPLENTCKNTSKKIVRPPSLRIGSAIRFANSQYTRVSPSSINIVTPKTPRPSTYSKHMYPRSPMTPNTPKTPHPSTRSKHMDPKTIGYPPLPGQLENILIDSTSPKMELILLGDTWSHHPDRDPLTGALQHVDHIDKNECAAADTTNVVDTIDAIDNGHNAVGWDVADTSDASDAGDACGGWDDDVSEYDEYDEWNSMSDPVHFERPVRLDTIAPIAPTVPKATFYSAADLEQMYCDDSRFRGNESISMKPFVPRNYEDDDTYRCECIYAPGCCMCIEGQKQRYLEEFVATTTRNKQQHIDRLKKHILELSTVEKRDALVRREKRIEYTQQLFHYEKRIADYNHTRSDIEFEFTAAKKTHDEALQNRGHDARVGLEDMNFAEAKKKSHLDGIQRAIDRIYGLRSSILDLDKDRLRFDKLFYYLTEQLTELE